MSFDSAMILQLYDPGAEFHPDRWSDISIFSITRIRFTEPLHQMSFPHTRISRQYYYIIIRILLNKLSYIYAISLSFFIQFLIIITSHY